MKVVISEKAVLEKEMVKRNMREKNLREYLDIMERQELEVTSEVINVEKAIALLEQELDVVRSYRLSDFEYGMNIAINLLRGLQISKEHCVLKHFVVELFGNQKQLCERFMVKESFVGLTHAKMTMHFMEGEN